MKIRVIWEVDDGYVGASRPQCTEVEIYDEDLQTLSEEEIEDIIHEQVLEDLMELSYKLVSKQVISDD